MINPICTSSKFNVEFTKAWNVAQICINFQSETKFYARWNLPSQSIAFRGLCVLRYSIAESRGGDPAGTQLAANEEGFKYFMFIYPLLRDKFYTLLAQSL